MQSTGLTAARALTGFLPVYKPRAVTSAGVVKKVRHCIENHFLGTSEADDGGKKRKRRRKPAVKVGHGGTLDPLAEGVLVLAIGDACRNLSTYLKGHKAYSCVGRLGQRTDTCDVTGTVVETAPFDHITLETLEKHLPLFRGAVLQTPPVYSALKREGKPLYEYAREGTADQIELSPRRIYVHSISVSAASDVVANIVDTPGLGVDDVTLEQAEAFEMTARFLPADLRSSQSSVKPSTELDSDLPFFGLRAVVGGGTYVDGMSDHCRCCFRAIVHRNCSTLTCGVLLWRCGVFFFVSQVHSQVSGRPRVLQW